MNGVFTISLDFELHWGGFEKWPLEKYRQYFLNTRAAIPRMLGMFEKHEVHVTWATVGMLFHESREELMQSSPGLRPSYAEKQLSAYDFINTHGIGKDEKDDPLHFAPSLIRQILGTRNQELGTHTYAHYYCNEAGQTVQQFDADLKAAQRVASKYGVTLRSLVFPRNQFNDEYLKVCFENGITSVRSNPRDWFWDIGSTQDESKWKRLNRGLDAYLPVGKHNTYAPGSIEVRDGFPVCIPASRLLRPYRPKEMFLNAMKIARIKSEMTRAARDGEVYHLWWHPHNFGNFTSENLSGLSEVLHHFSKMTSLYGMKSMNMGEIANLKPASLPKGREPET